MSTVLKISPQCQIRIPKKVMAQLKIIPGDYVEVDVDRGNVVLKPRKLIDPSQGWYWTKEWQNKESEADKDLVADRVSPEFQTTEEATKWLDQ